MEKKQQKLIRKLKSRYRLVIMNDSSFEEKFSFRLTPLNVFVGFSSFLVFFAGIISILIIYTPLREYIPGYTDQSTRENLVLLLNQSDSLEKVLSDRDAYYKNILNILNDNIETSDSLVPQVGPIDNTKPKLNKSEIEAEFVQNYEKQKDEYALSNTPNAAKSRSSSTSFYPPVSGFVSKKFNRAEQHLAVDIVTKPNESVKSVLDGRVIFASWTPETGHVIIVQHGNNILSVYKHNASILKKYGTFVRAGEPIAIVGNSGEQTSGPHLHFELWDNAKATNPENFIKFN